MNNDTTFGVDDSLVSGDGHHMDASLTSSGSGLPLVNASSNNPDYFHIPKEDINDYMATSKQVEEFLNGCNAKTLDEWQVALEMYLSDLEAQRKREIEEETRHAKAIETSLITALASRSPKAAGSDAQQRKKYETAKAELHDLYEQYKRSRNSLESMCEQHNHYLEKESAFVEKTTKLVTADDKCRTEYQECVDRYNALAEHVHSLVSEGDATVTAMIERHQTATIDARTKERLLDLKKRALEKKESELRAEVDELMEMVESILAVRAGGVEQPDDTQWDNSV